MTEQEYKDACAASQTEPFEFENQVLSSGASFPPCVVAVLKGNDPSPEYWAYLAAQLGG
jgi:hypothetical protein